MTEIGSQVKLGMYDRRVKVAGSASGRTGCNRRC